MKRIYITPKIRIHKLDLDDLMTMIQWSGGQEEEGFAKEYNPIIDDEDLEAATIMNEYGFDKPIPDQFIR